jgi:hypothetical protein
LLCEFCATAKQPNSSIATAHQISFFISIPPSTQMDILKASLCAVLRHLSDFPASTRDS